MVHGPPADPVLTPRCTHISATGLSLPDATIARAHGPKPSSFFWRGFISHEPGRNPPCLVPTKGQCLALWIPKGKGRRQCLLELSAPCGVFAPLTLDLAGQACQEQVCVCVCAYK